MRHVRSLLLFAAVTVATLPIPAVAHAPADATKETILLTVRR